MLVSPVAAWSRLSDTTLPWAPLLSQWLLVVAGWTVSAGAWGELSQSAGLQGNGRSPGPGAWLAGASTIAVMLVLCLVAVTLQTLLALRLTGRSVSLRKALTLSAHALMPLFLGRSLNLALLTVLSPLAVSQADALALQLAPAPLSAAGLMPALSLLWVVLAFFDLFGVWSMWLYWLGLRRYLGFERQLAAWSMVALVLSWLLILTAIWQGIHCGLL